MKTTVRMIAMAMLAMGIQTAAARKGDGAKIVDNPKAADTVVVYKTDTVYINNVVDENGNVGEVAQITNQYQLEAYKAKLLEESNRNHGEKELDLRRRQMEDEVYENRQSFNLLSSYFSLFMFGLGVPCLVVFIYLHYSKNRQQRYEMLIDLLRTGVEVKPEVLDALSVKSVRLKWHTLVPNPKNAIAAESYTYCVKRLAWVVVTLVVGVAFSALTHNGGFFYLSLVLAVIFLMQAAVRYFSMIYIAKNSATSAGNGTDNISTNNKTPDNNAQQP